jgi:apolipoprotein N-acyltransferase
MVRGWIDHPADASCRGASGLVREGSRGNAAIMTAPDDAEPGWSGARRLLRGQFRTLVGGQVLGQAGDGLAQIAFAQLVLFEVGRGATPGEIAGVLAATLLPFSIVGPFAGVLIDRWDRRRALATVSALRAVLAAAGIVVATVRSEPAAYVGVLLLLSSSRFVLAGKGAVLPRTVPQGALVTANATSALAGMAAAFLGALAGSAFVGASVAAGFAAAAACYAAAAVVFLRLPDVGGGALADVGARLGQVVRDFADGVRVVATVPAVGRPLLAVWLHRALLGAGFIVLVLVADARYDLEAPGYALALAVTGVAAVTGSVVAPLVARRFDPQQVLPLAFLLGAVAALLGGYWPDLAVLVAAVGLASFAFQLLKVLVDALVGRAAPDAVRGRVFSAYDVLYNLAFVLAGLVLVRFWTVGAERRVLWWLAAAFGGGWVVVGWLFLAWPMRPLQSARATAPWRRRLAALAAGAAPVLAFPEPGLAALAWVALVPWLLVVRSAPTAREAAVLAWCGANGFLLVTHHWLTPNLGPALLLVTALVGLLWLPVGIAVHALLGGRPSVRRTAAACVVVPSTWVIVESVRSWSSLGGPWGLLGTTQWEVGSQLSLAALGGVWLLSFVVVAANVAVVGALVAAGWSARTVSVGAAAAALAAGPLWDSVRTQPVGGRSLQVAVVQPGVVHGAADRLSEGERLTGLLSRPVDLVVWGESSIGFDLERRADLLRRVQELSARTGAPLLVNVDARVAGGQISKRSVLADASGLHGSYEKTRLVPFGEYVPFRRALGWVTGISEAAQEDRRRGGGPRLLSAGAVRIAPLVCFESAFPDLARRAVVAGADVVVYQSSTSTFQGSWAPEQHASLAAVRAVEVGRPVVHATLTGVSAAYDARGRRLLWLGTSRRTASQVALPLTGGRTPFVRYGDWVLATAWTVVATALATATLRQARLVASAP